MDVDPHLLFGVAVGGVLDSALGTEDVVVGFGVPEGGVGKVVHPKELG